LHGKLLLPVTYKIGLGPLIPSPIIRPLFRGRGTKPLSTLEQVWAMKQAAEEETRGLTDPAAYFRYIRNRISSLGIPAASAGPNAKKGTERSLARRWRAAGKTKARRP